MTTASEILSPETGGFSGKPHSHGATPVPGDSRGERHRSFELSDFAVPVGREEEWRFTPLHRLRHLHEDDGTAGADNGVVSVEVDAAPEVHVETVARGDERLGKAGVPGDRVAARAWSSFEKATVVTVPRDAVASRPTVVTIHGEGVDKGAAYGHLLVDVREDDVTMGHEATVSKVSEDQLFYLMSRGLTEDEAMAMIVRGFVEPIAKELPMEYALELNRLIELQMEGAVG